MNRHWNHQYVKPEEKKNDWAFKKMLDSFKSTAERNSTHKNAKCVILSKKVTWDLFFPQTLFSQNLPLYLNLFFFFFLSSKRKIIPVATRLHLWTLRSTNTFTFFSSHTCRHWDREKLQKQQERVDQCTEENSHWARSPKTGPTSSRRI